MPEVSDFKLNIGDYYGPLDLLLHLVKETEVDITHINLVPVCEQYIGFLKAMERLNIDLSGDFLALASQLLLIKSRAIAPAPETGEEEEAEEEEDASLELIKKLLEYKRFKDRVGALEMKALDRSRRFARPRQRQETGPAEPEPLRNLELWDLVLMYSRMAKATRLDVAISLLYNDVPMEIFIEKILKALAEKQDAAFSELVGDRKDRTQVIGTFLAILELAKEQRVRVVQETDGGDIRIRPSEPPGEDADLTPPQDPPAAP